MLHIVLDANAIGVDPPLGKVEHRVLLDAHREGQILLVVPKLALREAVNGWKREVTQQSSKLHSARQKMAQLHPEYALHLPALDRTAAAQRLLEERIEMLETAGVLLPETPEVSHEELISRALERRQPFDQNGNGYRDTLLWQIVRDIAAEGHGIVLVSNDRAAFAEERKEGAPLAQSLAAELGSSAQLFAHLRTAIDELGLVALDAIEAARAVIDRRPPDFAETLRSRLVEDLAHPVHRWEARDLVNPFISTGASLGVAHEAIGAHVLEARRSEHDRLEATVRLDVRQFATIFVPDAMWDRVSHLGQPFVSDDEVAGVEIDARVSHLCTVVLDPINDRILEATAQEVIEIVDADDRGIPLIAPSPER